MAKRTFSLIVCHIAVVALLVAGLSYANADTEEGRQPTTAGADQRHTNTGLPESPIDATPRDVSAFSLFQPQISGAMFDYEVPDTETVLESGLYGLGASPAQIAIMGTPVGSSVRCQWHGLARTNSQREEALRLVLGLSATDTLPTTASARETLNSYVTLLAPQYRDAMEANFNHIIDGGLLEDGQFLACYVDYSVTEYVLGAGTSNVTVVYDNLLKRRSYDLYQNAHAAGRYGSGAVQSRSAYAMVGDAAVVAVETQIYDMMNGRESVIFLAPMGDHGGVAVEAWQAVAQWDVQSTDGVKHAVRYGAHDDDEDYSQTLANLKTRVTTAAASDAHAGKRIANTSGLTQHYRDMGAYDDLTPDDGNDTTFTPSQPPAMPACATGSAVSTPTSNRGLVRDCSALLAGHETLKGSGTGLNWSSGLAIASWTGVALSQTPQRVTSLSLGQQNLQGTIPQELGSLTALGTLDLSNNSLTGEIPAQLADLPLSNLRLAGNQLTGCIPAALRDIETHDLDQLGLLYCDAMMPNRIVDLRLFVIYPTRVVLQWSRPTSPGTPITGYRIQSKLEGGEFEDVTFDIDGQVSGLIQDLVPATQYTYRVAAVNAVGQGEWSNVFSTATPAAPPERITETSAQARGETSITLRWQAPRDNGSAITSYMIQHRALPSTVYVDVATVPAAEPLEYVDTGLAMDTGYIYRIKAVNGIGAAPDWSYITGAYTALQAPPSVTSLTAATTSNASIALTWVPGVGDNRVYGYEIQRFDAGSPVNTAVVAGSVTQYEDTGLAPDTTYTYQVRATNAAGESEWSHQASATTLPALIFTQRSYPFSIYGGTLIGTALGTVSGPAGTDSSIAYDIEGGGGKFAIDGTTGLLSTTNALLDYDTVSAYRFAVTARYAGREQDRVSVTVSVVAPCTDSITVANPVSHPLRVADCKVLIAARDTLRGTGTLNWSGGLSMSQWDGVELLEDVEGVHILDLPERGLNGTIPAGLGSLSQVTQVKLDGNQLTGAIPRELGGLNSLTTLNLNDNQLSGSLPAELGNLSSLQNFRAVNNDLTGSIPAELANPPNLTHLYLAGNDFTGCLPAAVGNIANHDLADMAVCAE